MVGTLDDVEAAVLAVEQAGGVAAAVDRVYPASAKRAIGPTCAMRAIGRRLHAVREVLLAFVTLMADHMTGVAPTVGALREALGTEHVLVTVRCILKRRLGALPTPLGFRNRVSA
jgi:hypothetical protein